MNSYLFVDCYMVLSKKDITQSGLIVRSANCPNHSSKIFQQYPNIHLSLLYLPTVNFILKLLACLASQLATFNLAPE